MMFISYKKLYSYEGRVAVLFSQNYLSFPLQIFTICTRQGTLWSPVMMPNADRSVLDSIWYLSKEGRCFDNSLPVKTSKSTIFCEAGCGDNIQQWTTLHRCFVVCRGYVGRMLDWCRDLQRFILRLGLARLPRQPAGCVSDWQPNYCFPAHKVCRVLQLSPACTQPSLSVSIFIQRWVVFITSLGTLLANQLQASSRIFPVLKITSTLTLH